MKNNTTTRTNRAVTITFLFVMIFLGTTVDSSAQLLSTKLNITVVDELGNPVEDATVSIYKTKDDYMQSQDTLMSATTDKKGLVKFKDLEPVSYFVDARTAEKNNDGKGAKIAPLEEGRVNKVNIVIE